MDWLDIKEFFKDAFKYIMVVVIVLFILFYVMTIQQVVGPSMEPTLDAQDICLLNKFYYRFTKVRRNDIISFEYDNTKYLIKRVIGLPGEHIEYRNNLLYINGIEYEETFIDTNTQNFSLEDLGYDIIPTDMYLVLGDNRENSLDSRDFGLVSKDKFIGKVSFRVFPLNKLKSVK